MLSVVTMLPEDDHLNVYEQCARDRLTPLLGPLRVTDRPGGPEGFHDFEADLPDGSVAALEVTSQVNGQRLSLASQAQRRLSTLTLPNSNFLWMVGLAAAAQVSVITANDLLRLLSDLETNGRRDADDMGDYRDPFVARLRALGIESVHALKAKTGYEGSVMVHPGTYGGSGWDGPTIDGWLRAFMTSGQGVNKLSKLGRATAAERHLVIVLDPFSQAGMGISLALTARHEREAADYAMPSFVPPEPLTHLWLLPFVEAWGEDLRWTRDGWTVIETRRPAPAS